MARLRTFIAVDIDKNIRSRAVALQENLALSGAPVKWVAPDNLHVTLLFLGEVDDRQIPRVCSIVGEVVRQHEPFPMSVETVGCFPNPRRPRILWIGVGEGTQPVCAIHDELQIPLQELGYRREERRYTPHITLGRLRTDKAAAALADALAKQASWKGGQVVVGEVLVMSSELGPEGPTYTVLSRAKLGGGRANP